MIGRGSSRSAKTIGCTRRLKWFMESLQVHPIAVVTGAGSGVGRAVAIALAEAGYKLVLAGRRAQALEETAAECSVLSKLAQPLIHVTDITDPDSVRKLFQRVEADCSRLDLLFNNAGISLPATPIETISDEDWLRCVQTNLSGVFYCTREAFRIMKEQRPGGGRIINNGSISSQTPRPGSAPYTATKHAVTGLTKSTALDGRAFNIACGQINIGNASTNMTERMSAGVPQADGSMAVEPTIDVRLVARAVVYMASLPLDANVLEMTVMATQMPFVGRG